MSRETSLTLATGNDQTLVQRTSAYPIQGMIIWPNAKSPNHSYGVGADGDPLPSLTTMHHHAVAVTHVLDDQGGAVMRVTEEDVSPTMREETRHHEPTVLCRDVCGTLCADDAKQVGNRMVGEGKLVVETQKKTRADSTSSCGRASAEASAPR